MKLFLKHIKIALLCAIMVRLHGAEQEREPLINEDKQELNNNNNDNSNDAKLLRSMSRLAQNEAVVMKEAKDYAKRYGVDTSLGWGFDISIKVRKNEVMTLPFFTSQSDDIYNRYANLWKKRTANEDAQKFYYFNDLVKFATQNILGPKALYLYHKRLITDDEEERAEQKAQAKRAQLFGYMKEVYAFLKGEKEDAKWAIAYLIGYALAFIGGGVFIVKIAWRIVDWMFLGAKPKIIDSELMTTWRSDWYTSRPKSRIHELKYNKDVKEWVDINIYKDKSRVLHYITHWFNKAKYTHKSVLLKGPAGTGKSSLAEEYAKECGYNYIKVGGSSWSQLPAGEAVTEFKNTVKRAEKSARPVVIFIDEVDRLVSKMSHSDVDSKVSGAFLNLFPMQRHKKIKFFFATNQPELLPDNFLSRCGDEVYVGIPTAKVAQSIYIEYLAKHAKTQKVDTSDNISMPTLEGLQGRQIEDICIEAAETASLADEPIAQQLIDKLVAEKQFRNNQTKQNENH